ncbi:hypothetical protein HKX48_002071, partial [Thoreauomyces humboldtii]
MGSLGDLIHRDSRSVSPGKQQNLPSMRQHMQHQHHMDHHQHQQHPSGSPYSELRERERQDPSDRPRTPASQRLHQHEAPLSTLAAVTERQQHVDHRPETSSRSIQNRYTHSPPSRPASAASAKNPPSSAPVPLPAPSQPLPRSYATSHHSRSTSGHTTTDLDDLPQLKPPQLNNVQDISDTAWVSSLDNHPYVRIRLKTKGTLCKADFHDLSPKKQQELIDRLIAKRNGQSDHQDERTVLSDDEYERLGSLIAYMEKHKRFLQVPAKRALPVEGDDEHPQRKRPSPKSYLGLRGGRSPAIATVPTQAQMIPGGGPNGPFAGYQFPIPPS